mmetsp:Transcript_11850/g.23860  ORF Transcript_11850/g.23860 Transcript_11850/m.23860 type:complete len:111 (+) Transcript_11850:1218-1550(+)
MRVEQPDLLKALWHGGLPPPLGHELACADTISLRALTPWLAAQLLWIALGTNANSEDGTRKARNACMEERQVSTLLEMTLVVPQPTCISMCLDVMIMEAATTHARRGTES